jgi:glutamate-1-semialdehyde aminotransferase
MDYQHARELIPGWGLFSKRPELFCDNWPVFYDCTDGIDLYANKHWYADFSLMGIGCCVLGYCDPSVDGEVKRAIIDGNMSTLNCKEELELTEKLIELHPWAEQVRYARTGGEALAQSVRIARAATGRTRVMVCGYSGWSDWYLAANLMGGNELDDLLMPGLEPCGVPEQLKDTCDTFVYNDLRSLEAKARYSPLAAIIMEPMRYELPKKGFLEGVRKIADTAGAVLIFDEVTSGFRQNCGGVHLKLGVTPDVCVLGKAMSNGYAMSVVIGKKSVMSAAEKTFISSTYWTERIGPTAALATIDKYRRCKVNEHICEIGYGYATGITNAAKATGLKVQVSNALGSVAHWQFEHPQSQAMRTLFTEQMLERGYLVTNTFYASYAHKREDLAQFLAHVVNVFDLINAAVETNTVEKQLKGRVAASGFKRQGE